MTEHKIIIGNSREMTELGDSSIELVVTSPPYWSIKDYGTENQIGYKDSYNEYIDKLGRVWKECNRVLKDGCKLCINIGDQYIRKSAESTHKVIPIREDIIRDCMGLGFDYMGAIIWQKVSNKRPSGGGIQMGSYPYPRNGIIKLDYEFILVFKKPGEGPKPTKEQKELSRLTSDEWNEYFTGHWYFPGERQGKHPAMYPVELPRRLIKMYTFVGETVLDPFLGSGTTVLAASKLDRNSIGYEINPSFVPVIKEKLGIEQGNLFPNAVFQIIER